MASYDHGELTIKYNREQDGLVTREKMMARLSYLQIAALRTRLRLAEEDVESVRREALLEGQARSLAEVEAARKKAAQAFARAEALRDRCARQVGGGRREETLCAIQQWHAGGGGGGQAAYGLARADENRGGVVKVSRNFARHAPATQ